MSGSNRTNRNPACSPQSRHCSGLGRMASDGPRGVSMSLRAVDDARLSPGNEDSEGFGQESARILNMEDVEEHGVIDAGIRQAGPCREEIPDFSHDVREARFVGHPHRLGDHARLDVKGEDPAGHELGGGEGEGPVSAAELDHVSTRLLTAEFFQEATGIEERFPISFVRHPTLAALHLHLPAIAGGGFTPLPFVTSTRTLPNQLAKAKNSSP